MKNLEKHEIDMISGGAWTSESFIKGAIGGGMGGMGVAGAYMGGALLLGSNPVGWAVLGIIGAGASIGGLYTMVFDKD